MGFINSILSTSSGRLMSFIIAIYGFINLILSTSSSKDRLDVFINSIYRLDSRSLGEKASSEGGLI